jgi:hypothetical protein
LSQVRGETAASLLPGKRLMIGDTIAPVSEVLGAESGETRTRNTRNSIWSRTTR